MVDLAYHIVPTTYSIASAQMWESDMGKKHRDSFQTPTGRCTRERNGRVNRLLLARRIVPAAAPGGLAGPARPVRIVLVCKNVDHDLVLLLRRWI